MKIQWLAIAFTIGLYIAMIIALRIADKFSYARGANDMGNALLTFAIAVLIIGFFFVRSIYQAIQIDPSYWQIVGLHVVCIFAFMWFFMR